MGGAPGPDAPDQGKTRPACLREAIVCNSCGPADWPALWALLEPAFRAGETFPHNPAITEAEAQLGWVEQSQAVMVAVDAAGSLVGGPMSPMRATWMPW